MNYGKIKRTFALALAAMLMVATPAQAAGYAAIVKSSKMTVYSDEDRSRKLGTLKAYTVVDILSEEDGMARISLKGKTGYAPLRDMVSISSLAEEAKITANTRVYKTASTKSASVKVKKGMKVNLLATKGGWAMVENSGVVAYMNKDFVRTLEQTPEATPVPTPKPTQKPSGEEVVIDTFSAEVTSSRMRVYECASTISTCLGSLKEGTEVTVLAYTREWAFIELSGKRGYAKVAEMRRLPDPEPTATPTPKPTPEPAAGYLNDTSYTIQERIHRFLVEEVGFNCAVACGVLANIEKESSFRLTAASYDGGYGLIQWTGGRNTRLKTWCNDNGYDYSSLEGQMWYLKYELEKYYPKIRNHLLTIDNDLTGAYDAAYYFCYNFEIPANRAARSVERGKLAQSKYWPKYSV